MKGNKAIYIKCIIFATIFLLAEIGLYLFEFFCVESDQTIIVFMQTLFWALFGSLAIGAVIAGITYQHEVRTKQRSLYITLLSAHLFYRECFLKRMLKDITLEMVNEAMTKFRRKFHRFLDELEENVLFEEVFEEDLSMNMLNDLHRELFRLHETIDMLRLYLQVNNEQEILKTFKE